MIKDMTLGHCLAMTASSNPTPGGGAIAAMTAASGVALVEMLAHLTIGKQGYEAVESTMQDIVDRLPAMREHFLDLADKDAQVFDAFMAALRLPKDSPDQVAYRKDQLQACYREAAKVPFEIGCLAYNLFKDAEVVIRDGNRNATTDGIIGAINARAAVKAAFLNVKINLSGIKDPAFVKELENQMAVIEGSIDEEEARLVSLGGY